MKIKSASFSFLRNLGQTDTEAENDGDKKTSSKKFKFSGFSIHHKSNDIALFVCVEV